MGKTKLFINCFRNPARTLVTENWRKHNSGKQPTVDSTLEPIQRLVIIHSVGKVIPHSNLDRQETPYKLWRSKPCYFTLQWMSCGRCSSVSNSSRNRWKFAEQSVIWVRINLAQHTHPSNITSMTQRQDTLIRTKPGHRIHLALKNLTAMHIQLLTPKLENKTQRLGKQMQSTKASFTNLKIPILWETGETIPRSWSSKVSFAVKFQAKDVEVGIRSDRNPRQDNVTMGIVHSPGSTSD